MNIAILLTGQIRQYFDVKRNIHNLVSDLSDKCNIDLFCTTNFEPNIDFNKLQQDFNFKILDIETYDEYTSQFIKNHDEFINFCNLYKNDNPWYLRFSNRDWENKVWKNIPVIFHKLHRGMKLIQRYSEINSIHYDIVIRLRWDILLENKFSYEDMLEVYNTKNLYVYQQNYKKYKEILEERESAANTDYHKYVDGWVDETIFYGCYKTMSEYSNIYLEYIDIVRKYNTWISHEIFKYYSEQKNIKIDVPHTRILLTREDKQYILFGYLCRN